MRMVAGAICLLAGIVAEVGAAMSSAAWATVQKLPTPNQGITFGSNWFELPTALFLTGIILAFLGIFLIVSGFAREQSATQS